MKALINKYHHLIALGILAIMLVLGLGSMRKDSAIVDEIAHIPAGYSYLKYHDYRLNPEHPPLLKDLAALPLQFMKLKFPLDIPAWTTDANGQWEAGWNFIYHIGNNADRIIFWARLPILLLALVFGYVIYWFGKRQFNPEVGLLSLVFYAFSPDILAHARFVTTDLGIAAFTFFAFLALFWFVKKPDWRATGLLAVFFALAQLAKFSAIVLVPFFILLVGIVIITYKKPKTFMARLRYWGLPLVIMFVISFSLVWLFYLPHVANMPISVQDKLIQASLPGGYYTKYGAHLVQLDKLPLMKASAQYLLGLLMVVNRVQSGNITYFLGQVTNQSFFWYFPVSFVMKTPIPLLILIASSLGLAAWQYLRRKPLAVWLKFSAYARDHFVELSFGLFIVFYSYLSIRGNLNLGIRHLFPMLPMIFILVAKKTLELPEALGKQLGSTLKRFGLPVLIGWYMLTPIWIYPKYLPYVNSLFGGSANAYRYLSDSNVDWGQDLKRLVSYVHDHKEIKSIAVDYFGGGEPHYYFCNRVYVDGKLLATSTGYDCSGTPYVEWHAQYGVPTTDYLAVSETFLENDRFTAAQRGDSGYAWLRTRTPIAKIGDSIYVYKLK